MRLILIPAERCLRPRDETQILGNRGAYINGMRSQPGMARHGGVGQPLLRGRLRMISASVLRMYGTAQVPIWVVRQRSSTDTAAVSFGRSLIPPRRPFGYCISATNNVSVEATPVGPEDAAMK